MQRTQIYLSEDQRRWLTILSQQRGVTVSELVRDAITQVYSQQATNELESALDAVTGLWADREDLPSTDEYVRHLREDNRLERLGL